MAASTGVPVETGCTLLATDRGVFLRMEKDQGISLEKEIGLSHISEGPYRKGLGKVVVFSLVTHSANIGI